MFDEIQEILVVMHAIPTTQPPSSQTCSYVFFCLYHDTEHYCLFGYFDMYVLDAQPTWLVGLATISDYILGH